MNKTELVDQIAKNADLSKKEAKDALEATLSAITGSLTKGDSVTLIGFGTFSVKNRAERSGVNPQTKEKMIIPAKKVVKFNPGANLKSAV